MTVPYQPPPPEPTNMRDIERTDRERAAGEVAADRLAKEQGTRGPITGPRPLRWLLDRFGRANR
jgi:hypothetical protein